MKPISKKLKRYKRRYDKDIRCGKLEPGNLALVKQKAFAGKYKIQNRWENFPCVVVEKPYHYLPVYRSDQVNVMMNLGFCITFCHFHYSVYSRTSQNLIRKNLQWNRNILYIKGF